MRSCKRKLRSCHRRLLAKTIQLKTLYPVVSKIKIINYLLPKATAAAQIRDKISISNNVFLSLRILLYVN